MFVLGVAADTTSYLDIAIRYQMLLLLSSPLHHKSRRRYNFLDTASARNQRLSPGIKIKQPYLLHFNC